MCPDSIDELADAIDIHTNNVNANAPKPYGHVIAMGSHCNLWHSPTRNEDIANLCKQKTASNNVSVTVEYRERCIFVVLAPNPPTTGHCNT